MTSEKPVKNDRSQIPAESGYGSPTPEDEMPEGAATNPGSPDPTLRGHTSDELSLDDDKDLGSPDRTFFENEDASSDGEPGAGRLGGTDDQSREELAPVKSEQSQDAPDDDASGER